MDVNPAKGEFFSNRHESNRIPQLDAVRGIAILLILIWHYGCIGIGAGAHPLLSGALHFFAWSWSGVDLFFVLSGFLIGKILLENRDAANYFQVFYVRRCCRILPAYWLVLAAFAILSITGTAGRLPNTSWLFAHPFPLWSYLLFIQNIFVVKTGLFGPHWLSVTWSLAIEEQFYLFLPLLIRFVSKKSLPYWLLGLIALAPITRLAIYLIYAPHVDLPRIALLPCKWDGLLLGAMAACFFRNSLAWEKLERNTGILIGALLVFGSLTGIILWKFGRDSALMTVAGFTVLALFYLSFMLLALISKGPRFQFLFNNRSLIFLGIHSYGIYLFHQIISGLCHGYLADRAPSISNHQQFFIAVLALALTILTAWISWNIMEKPFIRLGHRLKYKPNEKIRVSHQ